jgi:hypothetical protein
MPQNDSSAMPQNDSSGSVFLSHDSRDVEIANSFAKLLQSASHGLLKCYFTSDKKGSAGIPYGNEWYPIIHEQIRASAHVICLLTEWSVGRPWILYEAGIAKGEKLPVTGLLINVASHQVNVGPFSHFQNCSHDEDSLIKLVFQLLNETIPGIAPEKSYVKSQVRKHRNEINKIFSKDTNDSQHTKESRTVIKFVENMKRNVATAMDFTNQNIEVDGDIDMLYTLFSQHPDDYLERFFTGIDIQFRQRVAHNGKLKRMARLVDFSSATLVGSLLELGLPLSLSLHVPSSVIDILETLIKDGIIDDEVESSHIRTAVVRSFDRLQENPEFSPDRIELTRSSYIRRYGNPDNQYLKVIDYGVEKDLNYSFITNELLPHVLKRILDTTDSPVFLYKEVFTGSRMKEMAREVLYAAGQLNVYSIRYKSLIHLIQDLVLQPPHPWIVSKETEEDVYKYNLERMDSHFGAISDALQQDEIPSVSYHHLKEFFQHSSASILSRYGGYLGVGSQYGMLELTRTLSLLNGNIVLWDNCRISQIESDLEKLDCSLAFFRRAASKVQEKLTSIKTQQNPSVKEIKSEIYLFRRLAHGFTRLR